MKPYIQNLLIIAFALFCFIAGCNWNRLPDIDGSTTKGDTIYLQGDIIVDIDTFIIQDSFPYPVPVAVRAVAHDSLNMANSPQLELCDSIRDYTNSLEDSAGMVIVNTSIQGVMINQDITLQAYQNNTLQRDTVKITNTVNANQKRIFAPTFGLRIDSVAVPLIGLMLSNKKGNIIYGGEVSSKKDITVKVGINLNR